MKNVAALALVASLAACASAPRPQAEEPRTGTSSAALTEEAAAPAKKTAAEEWAERKIASEESKAKSAPREGGDPLAMNSEIEEASIPKIEMTPAKELRGKSRGELQAALSVMKSASTVEEAAKKLTARLGKPTWTENGKKHVWVAPAGAQCHRLVLEADGTVEIESASKGEWRMLSALARQNPCTGEIKRGITAK